MGKQEVKSPHLPSNPDFVDFAGQLHYFAFLPRFVEPGGGGNTSIAATWSSISTCV